MTAPVNPAKVQISGFSTLIPPFTGDETMEVEAFFKIADSVKAQAQWDDLVAISVVRSKFRGAAASFWQRSIALQAVTAYDEFKRQVIDYFKPKLPLAVQMAQFFELRQEKDEKVKTFATRLLNKANKVFPQTITDSEKSMTLAQFIKGLQPPLKRLVLTREPRTFEDAQKYAKLEESNEEMLHPKEKSFLHALGSTDDAQSFEEKMRAMLRKSEEEEKALEPKAIQAVQSTGKSKSGKSKVLHRKGSRI